MRVLGIALLPQRFWDKINVFGPTGCWEWSARRSVKGYGQIMYEGKVWQAHRLSFTKLVRDIPKGLVLDHICDNRCCVNPGHLDVVTVQHNNFCGWGASSMQIRFPECKLGHPFDGEDSAGRFCITCRRRYKRDQMRIRRTKH